ncbi:hypothetical protein ACFXDH_51700 [Streptomyces sp. NPDC059467]|uniref:hypothetical protein n=1 Tax=Streptomyces sp. NPDC059467 TaxID=3346844 RepID=UPI0036CB7017
MTTTPNPPDQAPACRPNSSVSATFCTALAARHPPGDRRHRLARALCQTSTELDIGYERAQQAGRDLQALRGRLAEGPGETDAYALRAGGCDARRAGAR